jgi:hypothetical protein
VRVASGPDPPGSSRCVFERRKRRFLAYAFPPRSPHPRRLAVPARHGFVSAAPAHPGTSRGRLPSASQSCCDRTTVQVSHLNSINKRLTAHRRKDAHGERGGSRSRPAPEIWPSKSDRRMHARERPVPTCRCERGADNKPQGMSSGRGVASPVIGCPLCVAVEACALVL